MKSVHGPSTSQKFNYNYCIQKSMLFIFLIFLITFVHCDEIFAVKRDILPSDAKQLENDENADAKKSNDNVSYDEYPMVVPKRAAMLLDRIMVALHHALEDGDKEGAKRIGELYRNRQTNKNGRMRQELMKQFRNSENDMNYYEIPVDIKTLDDKQLDQMDDSQPAEDDAMDLQRRGHGEALGLNRGRMYWRCYFNAVSCF